MLKIGLSDLDVDDDDDDDGLWWELSPTSPS